MVVPYERRADLRLWRNPCSAKLRFTNRLCKQVWKLTEVILLPSSVTLVGSQLDGKPYSTTVTLFIFYNMPDYLEAITFHY